VPLNHRVNRLVAPPHVALNHRKIPYRSECGRGSVSPGRRERVPSAHLPSPYERLSGEAGGGTYPGDRGRDPTGGCQGVDGPEPSTLLDEHEARTAVRHPLTGRCRDEVRLQADPETRRDCR